MSWWEMAALARERHRDLEHEAVRARPWRTGRPAQRGPVGRWRRALGSTLVRLGCWLLDGNCVPGLPVAVSQNLFGRDSRDDIYHDELRRRRA